MVARYSPPRARAQAWQIRMAVEEWASERLRHVRGVEAVRDGEGESSSGVDDHAGVKAMTVPSVSAEEGGCVVVRLCHQKTLVTSQTPSGVGCVPFHAAANVDDEEGGIARHAQTDTFEHRQAADSARAVHAP